MDAAELADLPRSDLAHEAPKGAMLRAVRQFVKNVDRLGPAGLIERAPSTTGDDRRRALGRPGGRPGRARRGCPRGTVPEWARARPLDEWWFVTDFPRLHPTAFVNTPPALARRNVYLTRAALESLVHF